MKHIKRLYSVTTTLLILLGLAALSWFVFFKQEWYPSMFGILALGAALAVLLHARSQGAERYGKGHVLRTDLLLLGGNLAAVAGVYGLISWGALPNSCDFSNLTGFVFVTMALAAYFNYGAPIPKQFFQRVRHGVNVAIFES